MISEPHRLQYLEAMGLTSWVARYQLSNARPSEACEWPEPSAEQSVEASTKIAPSERLQALLAPEAAVVPGPPAGQAQPGSTLDGPGAEGQVPSRAAMPRRARAMLDDLVPEDAGTDVKQGQESAPSAAAPLSANSVSGKAQSGEVQALTPSQASWQFSLQVACLDSRWLVIVPDEQALSASATRLLSNLFTAAGMTLEQPPSFESYRWPPFQGVSQGLSHDPRQDAQDGFGAFLAGRQRLGWVPEQVFVFGMDKTLEALLAIEGQRSAVLDLPVWLGPELGALSTSAEAKRALWPQLASWRPASHD